MATAPAAFAEASWTLTTADFRSERVDLRAIDERSATVVRPGDGSNSQQQQIQLDRLLMLQRIHISATSAPAKFVALLAGNDRAAGQPKSLVGENLVWENPTLGELTLPLKSIVAIVRIPPDRDAQPMSLPSLAQLPPATQRTEDVLTLANGDSVRGIISTIGATSISVQRTDAEAIDVPLDSIVKVTFASTGGAAQAGGEGFRVSLADETAITAAHVRLDDPTGKLQFVLPDGSERAVQMSQVTSIEHVNGPVVWLSSLRPIESVQTPFLDMSWPARMDRAVDGDQIRFGDRVYARGIGVHSYSRLVFPIDPKMHAFRTQYAIAGEWPYANVTVRIKLDSNVVYEKSDVRSGVLSQPVMIDLEPDAKTLVLEVDYGQNYDVQDRFNWIEPAFVKFKPEVQAPSTAPSTAPATQPE